MRKLTNAQVAAAPLPPGPAAEAWRSYLVFWHRGERVAALATVDRFVGLLVDSGQEAFAAFADWLCSTLFDHSDYWSGQWGGGMTQRHGRWERPVEPILTVHPVTARVTLPYLISSLSRCSEYLRWAYQFTVGQSYRLPPEELRRWREAVETVCGPGAPPIELLQRASDDVLAQRMLRDAEQRHRGDLTHPSTDTAPESGRDPDPDGRGRSRAHR